jgi:quercetin dioxygenase-like cupin family protein
MTHRNALALAALVLPVALAAQNPTTPAQQQVIVAHSATLMWKAGPPSLPPGAEIAVLEGNPTEAGPFTFRLKFPPNYRIPPHSHHALEHITVLTGTLNVGMGDQATWSGGAALTEASYGVVPPGMTHYAWTGTDGVTIQLHSMGPWTITYVNPADDPRTKRPAGN